MASGTLLKAYVISCTSPRATFSVTVKAKTDSEVRNHVARWLATNHGDGATCLSILGPDGQPVACLAPATSDVPD